MHIQSRAIVPDNADSAGISLASTTGFCMMRLAVVTDASAAHNTPCSMCLKQEKYKTLSAKQSVEIAKVSYKTLCFFVVCLLQLGLSYTTSSARRTFSTTRVL
jgi:hypothetical protein